MPYNQKKKNKRYDTLKCDDTVTAFFFHATHDANIRIARKLSSKNNRLKIIQRLIVYEYIFINNFNLMTVI